MNKGYTIFFGSKPYIITNELAPELLKLANSAGTLMCNHPNKTLIANTILDIEKEGTKAVIILTNEVEQYWKIFSGHFSAISAGGGVVQNEKNEVLFIFRRKKWDLPKGKLDEGETIEECAVREVKEETGLKFVSVTGIIGNTYHTYHEKGKHILKTSVWYRMEAAGNQLLIPQTEEDIEKMEWLPKKRWEEVFSNTYPAIKIILADLDA